MKIWFVEEIRIENKAIILMVCSRSGVLICISEADCPLTFSFTSALLCGWEKGIELRGEEEEKVCEGGAEGTEEETPHMTVVACWMSLERTPETYNSFFVCSLFSFFPWTSCSRILLALSAPPSQTILSCAARYCRFSAFRSTFVIPSIFHNGSSLIHVNAPVTSPPTHTHTRPCCFSLLKSGCHTRTLTGGQKFLHWLLPLCEDFPLGPVQPSPMENYQGTQRPTLSHTLQVDHPRLKLN